MKGGPDFAETFCKWRVRSLWLRREARDKTSRNLVFPAISRALIKVAVLNLGKTMGIRFQLRFDFITHRRERGTRARVGDDALPRGIAVHLRQNGGQIFHQLFPFLRRQSAYRRFDFLDRAHRASNVTHPGWPRQITIGNGLKDVRLALRVVAEQEMEARRKVGVQPRIIAEVPESQMGQMHAEKIGARTACPRVFSDAQSYHPLKSFSKFPNPFGNEFSTDGRFAAIREAATFIASVSTASEG